MLTCYSNLQQRRIEIISVNAVIWYGTYLQHRSASRVQCRRRFFCSQHLKTAVVICRLSYIHT